MTTPMKRPDIEAERKRIAGQMAELAAQETLLASEKRRRRLLLVGAMTAGAITAGTAMFFVFRDAALFAAIVGVGVGYVSFRVVALLSQRQRKLTTAMREICDNRNRLWACQEQLAHDLRNMENEEKERVEAAAKKDSGDAGPCAAGLRPTQSRVPRISVSEGGYIAYGGIVAVLLVLGFIVHHQPSGHSNFLAGLAGLPIDGLRSIAGGGRYFWGDVTWTCGTWAYRLGYITGVLLLVTGAPAVGAFIAAIKKEIDRT